MEATPQRKPSKLDEFKPSIFQFLEKVARNAAIFVNNNCACFVVVPVLVAITFLALCLTSPTPQDPGQNDVPTVKEMFLALKDHPVSFHRYEEEWWENSCYDPRNSRQSAHVIVTSKHDIVSNMMRDEIIRLHNFITDVHEWDYVHDTRLTYRDVCMQPTTTSDYPIRNQSTLCATDRIIELFMCTIRSDFLALNLRMDKDTKSLWGFLDFRSDVNQSSYSHIDSWCKKQINRQVFLGESVCKVDDHMQTEAISAGCLGINYYLKDLTARDNLKSSIWLRQLEKTLPTFDSSLLQLVVGTTESSNIQWRNLVDFTVVQAAMLCLMHFLLSLLLLLSAHNNFRAAYLSFIGIVSLIMTLVSSYSLHVIVYKTPRFSMTLCFIFIAVVHFLFFILSMESYFRTHIIRNSYGQIHGNDCFVEFYIKSLSTITAYFLLFTVVFGLAAIPESIISLRYFCVTSCLGYCFSFFYLTTFFPAALQCYNSRIHNVVEQIQIHVATAGQSFNDFSISESVFLDDDAAATAQTDPQPEEAEEETEKKKDHKLKKFKSKLKQWYCSYAAYAVCGHMRAVSALLYLTYFSCSCVGCVHFTERISPEQLISQDSLAYDYYSKASSYFRPYGTPFTVYGVFHGQPWNQKAVKDLFQIHRSLVEMDTIDSSLSVNWFQNYFARTTENWQHGNKSNISKNKMFTQKLENPDGFPAKEINSENVWSKVTEIDKKIWQQYDWHSSWANFTQSPVYEEYRKDIVFVASGSAHHEGEDDISQIKFQWLYYTINVNLPSKQKELISRFQEILNRVDKSVISLLVFDSPELDWWTSIGANRFSHCFVALVLFGLFFSLFLIALVKWKLAVIWCIGVAVSMEFGAVGFISLFGVGCDPLSIPSILFLIPCSIFVTLQQLMIFFKHRGGRAESASASLKNSCSRSTSLCLMLFCSSLVLTSSSSYIYRAPLVGLLCSVVIVLLHYFLFVPFLLTVMPPQKKKKRHVGKKKLKSEINNGTNTPSMNANQPSEEPKRQNSNTLKVPGRQREKLERTEHVTSV